MTGGEDGDLKVWNLSSFLQTKMFDDENIGNDEPLQLDVRDVRLSALI